MTNNLECHTCGAHLTINETECKYCGTPNRGNSKAFLTENQESSLAEVNDLSKSQLLHRKEELLRLKVDYEKKKKNNLIMAICLFWLYYIPLIIGLIKYSKYNKLIKKIDIELMQINGKLLRS